MLYPRTLFNLGLEKVIRECYKDRILKVVGEETALAYADDTVLLGCIGKEITHLLSNLIETGKNMDLYINKEKSKLI